MPEPYLYVRAITITLGVIWAVLGLLRLVRFALLWRARFDRYGLERVWFRRQLRKVVVRTTVLDPVSLALMCALVLVWSLRHWLEP